MTQTSRFSLFIKTDSNDTWGSTGNCGKPDCTICYGVLDLDHNKEPA